MARDEAVALFRKSMASIYKAEIIAAIPARRGDLVCTGRVNGIDLCRGPHVPIDRQAQGASS